MKKSLCKVYTISQVRRVRVFRDIEAETGPDAIRKFEMCEPKLPKGVELLKTGMGPAQIDISNG